MAADTLVSPQATATNSLVSSILLSSVWCFSLLLLSGNGLPADRQTHKHQHAPIPASRYTLNAEKLYRGTLSLNTHSHAQTVYILMYKDTHIASFGPPAEAPHSHACSFTDNTAIRDAFKIHGSYKRGHGLLVFAPFADNSYVQLYNTIQQIAKILTQQGFRPS